MHKILKIFIQDNLKSEKLRLGLWEKKEREEIAKNLGIDKMANYEKLRAKKVLIKINSIYYLGCKKLIKEKIKIDWEERDPNLKGKQKRKKGRNNKELYGCKKNKNRNKRNISSVLKDKGKELTECELKEKENVRLSVAKSKRKMKKKKRRLNEKKKSKTRQRCYGGRDTGETYYKI
jgi:hypothetical protein